MNFIFKIEVWSIVVVVVLVELLHADVRYAGAVRSQLDAVAPETALHVVHGTYSKSKAFTEFLEAGCISNYGTNTKTLSTLCRPDHFCSGWSK